MFNTIFYKFVRVEVSYFNFLKIVTNLLQCLTRTYSCYEKKNQINKQTKNKSLLSLQETQVQNSVIETFSIPKSHKKTSSVPISKISNNPYQLHNPQSFSALQELQCLVNRLRGTASRSSWPSNFDDYRLIRKRWWTLRIPSEIKRSVSEQCGSRWEILQPDCDGEKKWHQG